MERMHRSLSAEPGSGANSTLSNRQLVGAHLSYAALDLHTHPVPGTFRLTARKFREAWSFLTLPGYDCWQESLSGFPTEIDLVYC